MHAKCDALVIGAGPAGSTVAILLAQAGWRVTLVEQHGFPRQKVCGECISAGSLTVLDTIGIGPAFHGMAGPELRYIGWMRSDSVIAADFPACTQGNYRYGRALGRDRLDAALLERARVVGVDVLQPAKVCDVRGGPGNFVCEIHVRSRETRHAGVVIDAHGSWQAGPRFAGCPEGGAPSRPAKRNSDLFAFKASFENSGLTPGLLPVIALEGGYGGIVVAEDGRTTLACCIRRDRLRACRESMPGAAAGTAVAAFLRRSCRGVREALDRARPEGGWRSAGPIRPGMRLHGALNTFRVGNAAGETHPLIGEGISMGLQSASLLAGHLIRESAALFEPGRAHEVNRRYAAGWRAAFGSRLLCAAGFAHALMRPQVAARAESLLRHWPSLLTRAARWAGKNRGSVVQSQSIGKVF